MGHSLDDGPDTTAPPRRNPIRCTPISPPFSSASPSHLTPPSTPRTPSSSGRTLAPKGSKEFTVNIRLEINYSPEKLKLSAALMEVLLIEVHTRARIIAVIWHYVKACKLQNPAIRPFFVCNPAPRKVFGEEKVKFLLVSQKILQHLSSPQPIILEHKIKLTGNGAIGSACYDVLVDIPFPLQKEMLDFLANIEKHKEVEVCDEVISASIKKIHKH